MYTPPFELDSDDRPTDTRLDDLGLEAGQKIAYVFVSGTNGACACAVSTSSRMDTTAGGSATSVRSLARAPSAPIEPART